MKESILFCKIIGTSPILFHRFDMSENIKGGAVRPKLKNETPEEVAEKSAYRDEDGQLYLPADCLMAAIVDAGKHMKLGKNKVTTNKSTIVYGALKIKEEKLYFGTTKFLIDSRAAVNQALNARIIVHRAKLETGWVLEFHVIFDKGTFTLVEIKQLISDAGVKCGVGSFRPNRKGPFGCFKIEEIHELK
jgi:hypothetical protein